MVNVIEEYICDRAIKVISKIREDLIFQRYDSRSDGVMLLYFTNKQDKEKGVGIFSFQMCLFIDEDVKSALESNIEETNYELKKLNVYKDMFCKLILKHIGQGVLENV